MTDYTELKRLAQNCRPERCADESEQDRNWKEFISAIEPDDVLALIAENERLTKLLERTVEQHVPLTELEGVPGWSRVVELVEVVTERDHLRAEVAGLRTGYEAYERVNAELKAEVGALRKLAPSKEIIWCACGDGHAANSYGAGFMDANGGVCANCDAAMGNGGRGGQSTSKTSESAYPEGLKGGGQ